MVYCINGLGYYCQYLPHLTEWSAISKPLKVRLRILGSFWCTRAHWYVASFACWLGCTFTFTLLSLQWPYFIDVSDDDLISRAIRVPFPVTVQLTSQAHHSRPFVSRFLLLVPPPFLALLTSLFHHFFTDFSLFSSSPISAIVSSLCFDCGVSFSFLSSSS